MQCHGVTMGQCLTFEFANIFSAAIFETDFSYHKNIW